MEATILLAEDEARLRTVVRDYFAAHGVACRTAVDGAEALEALRKAARNMGDGIERSIQPRQQERGRRHQGIR